MTTTHDPDPTQARTATSDDCDAVFVSAPIGEGARLHRRIRKGPWDFTALGADGTEPLLRDVDAAERLGFGRPRDVRKLIERIWPENKRPQSRATVARQRTRHGGERTFTVREYWLTEAEVLKVCARSETPIAEAILDEMIAVYIAVRRGLAPASSAASAEVVRAVAQDVAAVVAREVAEAVVAPVVARLDLLTDRVRVVEEAQVPRADTVFCGATEAARLRAGMRRVAHLRTALQRPLATLPDAAFRAQQKAWRRAWKRALGEVQRAVADVTAHEGLGKHWDLLPVGKLTDAWACVRRLEAEAEQALDQERRGAKEARANAQQSLPLDGTKGAN